MLGRFGLKVSALSLGTATYGGSNAFFRAWGDTDAGGARALIDRCPGTGAKSGLLANRGAGDAWTLGLFRALDETGQRQFIWTIHYLPYLKIKVGIFEGLVPQSKMPPLAGEIVKAGGLHDITQQLPVEAGCAGDGGVSRVR